MNGKERRREPRPQHLKAWNDDARRVFRSVEAVVLQEITAPIRCPRCQAAAESLRDRPTMMDWSRCCACENLWAPRSSRAG